MVSHRDRFTPRVPSEGDCHPLNYAYGVDISLCWDRGGQPTVMFSLHGERTRLHEGDAPVAFAHELLDRVVANGRKGGGEEGGDA
jgi:hypothetical protein